MFETCVALAVFADPISQTEPVGLLVETYDLQLRLQRLCKLVDEAGSS